MKPIREKTFKELAEHCEPQSVSILMPAHPAGQDTRQDPTRLKNLIRRAEEELARVGLAEGTAEKRLAELHRLLQDGDFWQHQGEGLAAFVKPSGETSIFRLPRSVDEQLMVGRRFQLKPLFSFVTGEDDFYLLSLSQHCVKLYRGDRYGLIEEDVRGLPETIEVLARFDDPERHVQFHTGTAPRRGRRSAVFHGQGVGTDEAQEKKLIMEFCRAVDTAVTKHLSGGANPPLILAAAEPLVGIYREANHYDNLHPTALHGNHERDDVKKLHGEALGALGGELDRDRQEALAAYHHHAGNGRSSNDLHRVLTAAIDHQVDRLFVAQEQQVWGRFNADDRSIELHDERQPGDEDLLNRAALETYRTAGRVYLSAQADMPTDKPVAATFRFAT
jgi:hypothetical protein